MDLTATVETKTDQCNGEDFLPGGRFGGPATFTVKGVSRGSAEQPVEIFFAEYDKPFRPCKTVRRILINAWGGDGKEYTGRQMTLYCDPKVRFGSETVGGIRIAALSHIGDKPRQFALQVSRGQRKPFTVKPIATAPELPIIDPDSARAFDLLIAEAADLDALKAIAGELRTMNLGDHKARLQAAWAAREAALKSAPAPEAVEPAEEKPLPAHSAFDEYGDLLDAAADQ